MGNGNWLYPLIYYLIKTSFLFRGQRQDWVITSSIFRGKPAKQEIEKELVKLTEFIRRLNSHKNFSEEQYVAIAQHYSAELDLKTWLIDMTWDPYIALFFASLGGKSGEIGKIVYVNGTQWDEFSASGSNRLGQITSIQIPDNLRIKAQRAILLFLSSSIHSILSISIHRYCGRLLVKK